MKKYEEPNIKVIFVKTSDVITTSGGLMNAGTNNTTDTNEGVFEWAK
ncbi:MAG: hypothetical protein IJN97_03480 [Oscillospiraceae bacterium]|nr:hypothetical protein [Oscillospiraceae bacterium]MBQ7054260.1 hypothetical protein [Oscillospiraceae bacterium]